MKKNITRAINIGILCVILLLIPTHLTTKAPFGKCTTPIVKPTKVTPKKSDRYALLDMDADAEELSANIPESQLIETIKKSFSRTFNVFEKSSFSFSKKQVNVDTFEMWINMLSCTYEWLENIKKYTYFKHDLVKIYSLSNFIYHYAQEFYNKKLTEAQKAVVKKEIAEKLKTVIQININAISAIEKSSDPKDWQKRVPVTSKLADSIEHYTDFFNEYIRFKKDNKYATESDYFNKILDKVTYPRNLEDEVNALEEVIYRLEHSFQWNIAQKIALTKFCKSFLQAILNRYGNGLYFISKAFENRLKRSTELPPKIVFDLSLLLFIGLNKLLNEL